MYAMILCKTEERELALSGLLLYHQVGPDTLMSPSVSLWMSALIVTPGLCVTGSQNMI